MKKLLFLFLLTASFFANAQNKNTSVLAVFLVNGKPNYGGELMLPEVLSISGLFLIKKGVEANLVSFEVTIIKKDGKFPFKVMNNGSTLEENAKKIFANANAGDTIYIDNIMVKTSEETTARKVNGLMIRVL